MKAFIEERPRESDGTFSLLTMVLALHDAKTEHDTIPILTGLLAKLSKTTGEPLKTFSLNERKRRTVGKPATDYVEEIGLRGLVLALMLSASGPSTELGWRARAEWMIMYAYRHTSDSPLRNQLQERLAAIDVERFLHSLADPKFAGHRRQDVISTIVRDLEINAHSVKSDLLAIRGKP